MADRVVQAALKLVLEPIFETDFEPVSYGYRPARRAHDAIAEIHLFGTQGYRWVLDADIEACLDALSHCSLSVLGTPVKVWILSFLVVRPRSRLRV